MMTVVYYYSSNSVCDMVWYDVCMLGSWCVKPLIAVHCKQQICFVSSITAQVMATQRATIIVLLYY